MRHALLALTLTATAAPAMASTATPLVSADWLGQRLGSADLVVLDIRNRIDGGSLDTFAAGHIPGSVHSDYLAAGWRGPDGNLPEIAALESLIGGLGIDNDDHVVVVPAGVSSTDFGSAARVYWTFKVLGHDAVSILDGGLGAWADAGLTLDTGVPVVEPDRFTADFRPALVATGAEVEAALANGTQLVDARPAEQFEGLAAHPAAGRAGTLPGAVNLQQQTLLDAAGRHTVTADTVSLLLESAGGSAAGAGEQIAFCNTGHWASVAWFALSEIAGFDDVSLYDGSMVEWSGDRSRPVVPGQSAAN